MRTQTAFKKITILSLFGAALLTGCATAPGPEGGIAAGPVSVLSFSPVTDPVEMVKWSRTFPGIRSIESYTMIVPVAVETSPTELPTFSEALPPGAVFVEAAGGETRTYRVIRHAPHQR
ncbi:MAG: hypothetical protein AB1813_16710 [Verrucomicrobiota bacterium]